jgi:hypothetical protein
MRKRSSALVVLFAVVAGCGDVASHRYADLKDARADQLFDRGWLPDLLPPSSTEIDVSNNLDLNESTGQFRFEPAEFNAFARVLEPYRGDLSAPSWVTSDAQKHANRGYPVYILNQDKSTWLFLCRPKEGTCEYRMWLHGA